jgi:hypothetical protein
MFMKKLCYAFCALVLLTILSACGSQTSATVASTPTKAAPTASPTPTPKTASDILTALKAQKMPIGETFVVTADNDVNKLLGRPGQYTSKVMWKDTRVTIAYINHTGADIDVSDGGSIEVCSTIVDAQNRFKYIQTISKSSSMFAEYEYLDGTAILRVSSQLTPTQAQAYDTAFQQNMK